MRLSTGISLLEVRYIYPSNYGASLYWNMGSNMGSNISGAKFPWLDVAETHRDESSLLKTKHCATKQTQVSKFGPGDGLLLATHTNNQYSFQSMFSVTVHIIT